MLDVFRLIHSDSLCEHATRSGDGWRRRMGEAGTGKHMQPGCFALSSAPVPSPGRCSLFLLPLLAWLLVPDPLSACSEQLPSPSDTPPKHARNLPYHGRTDEVRTLAAPRSLRSKLLASCCRHWHGRSAFLPCKRFSPYPSHPHHSSAAYCSRSQRVLYHSTVSHLISDPASFLHTDHPLLHSFAGPLDIIRALLASSLSSSIIRRCVDAIACPAPASKR